MLNSCPKFFSCSERSETFTEKCRFKNNRNMMLKINKIVVGRTAPTMCVNFNNASYQMTTRKMITDVIVHKIEYSIRRRFLLARSITTMKNNKASDNAKSF
jgi:hypothetical protein